MSIRNELLADILSATENSGAGGLVNRVTVSQASDLSGVLDSGKEYFIDGVIDMGSQSIEIPLGGLSLSGYNFELSQLISSANDYTMFTSPIGGSGNVLGMDYAITCSGTNSQVYDITDATGNNAFEFSRINYNNCTSLGEITGYRQGLESGTGRFGGSPQLTLSGAWAGGYFITSSIVRSINDAAYSLFSAGAGFVMQSRFRTNANVDLSASASFFDFQASNFPNPSTIQVDGSIVTRGGVFDATDINITPNIDETSLSCSWVANNGMKNTFEGGSIGVSSEAETTINTAGVFEALNAGSWTALDLQHFDNPQDGRLRNLGTSPREYNLSSDLTVDGGSNDELTVRVAKWDDSASSLVSVLDQTRQVNSLVGGRDVAFFNININLTLDINDYVFLQIANQSNTGNVTVELDSYYVVRDR